MRSWNTPTPSSKRLAAPTIFPASPSSIQTSGQNTRWGSTFQATQHSLPGDWPMFTRRRFLVLFPAFAASAHAQTVWPLRKKKPVPPPPPLNVYIGTDTSKGVSKGIYQSHFDTTKGQLAPPVLAAATARPSFLAITPVGQPRRSLYAVNAINDPAATPTTFIIDPKTGALKQTGQASSRAAGPSYISVDDTPHPPSAPNPLAPSPPPSRTPPPPTS